MNETGERQRFRSSIVPPWCRTSPKVAEVLPLIYLHSLSTGDFVPALEEFFGSAAGLSSSVITRLTKQWQAERDAFMRRDLSAVDYLYVWVDYHVNIRLEEERFCTLVMVGVRADGTKELVAIGDGYRESTDSWADLLRDLRSPGMRAPVLAVGDGALGFWSALRDVFPDTRSHAVLGPQGGNVLAALSDLGQRAPGARCAEVRETPKTATTRCGPRSTILLVEDHSEAVAHDLVNPDGSLTVNAYHLYLLGPTAVGDLHRRAGRLWRDGADHDRHDGGSDHHVHVDLDHGGPDHPSTSTSTTVAPTTHVDVHEHDDGPDHVHDLQTRVGTR